MSGAMVFARTRVPVQTLLDYLEEGDTLDHFLEDFPTVSREHALAVLELAKEWVFAHAILLDACVPRRFRRLRRALKEIQLGEVRRVGG
jgi:uncharacterized protein (DUF433 family)